MEQRQILTIAGIAVGAVILLKVITAVTSSYQINQINKQIQAQQEAATRQAEAYKEAQLTAVASQPTPVPRSLSYHQKSMKASRTRKTKSKVINNANPTACCDTLNEPYRSQCRQAILQIQVTKMDLYNQISPMTQFKTRQDVDNYIQQNYDSTCSAFHNTDASVKEMRQQRSY